jgi:hypothetical protein
VVPSAVAVTGSPDDPLSPQGPSAQFEITDATMLKSSMAIITHRLAQINHYRWCRP